MNEAGIGTDLRFGASASIQAPGGEKLQNGKTNDNGGVADGGHDQRCNIHATTAAPQRTAEGRREPGTLAREAATRQVGRRPDAARRKASALQKTAHSALVDNFVEKCPARGLEGPFDGHLIGVSRCLGYKKSI
ncbi:hypothetical protein WCQ02_05565 [Paraburkholderia tropica]|uniref:hypothetical protein n=1 Tax=Paraburkholderia tropica TaxID=92647 RepID=UPI0030160936